MQAGEQCDDGNISSSDGCSATCELETLACDGGVIGERIVTVNLCAGGRRPRDRPRDHHVSGGPDGDPRRRRLELRQSRISGTPAGGSVFVNDQEGLLSVRYVGLPPNTHSERHDDAVRDRRLRFLRRHEPELLQPEPAGHRLLQQSGRRSDAGQLPARAAGLPGGQFPPPGANPAPCNTVERRLPDGGRLPPAVRGLLGQRHQRSRTASRSTASPARSTWSRRSRASRRRPRARRPARPARRPRRRPPRRPRPRAAPPRRRRPPAPRSNQPRRTLWN